MTETWLSEHKDAEVYIQGYQIYRSDCIVKRTKNCGRERGGVAVYLRDDLTPLTKTILKYSNGAVEVLVLHVKQLNAVLIVVYRHPDDPNGRIRSTANQLAPALEAIRKSLDELPSPVPELIMCGDFNLPHALWSSRAISPGATSDEQRMIEMIHNFADCYFMSQLISGPTQRSGNTLDLCFSNNPALLYNYDAINTLYSDHKILQCNTKLCIDDNNPEPETYRVPQPEDGPQAEFDNLNFFSEDVKWDEIEQELSEVSWPEELAELELYEMVERINEICLTICRDRVPERTTVNRKRSKIPRTRRILMRRRCKVNKQLSYVKSQARRTKLEDEAREIEKKLQLSYKQEHSDMEGKAVNSIKTNPKYFFTYAKKFSTVKSSIGPLLDSAKELIFCPAKMADILSKQYSSVFSTPKSPLLDPSDYFSDDDTDEPNLSDIPFTQDDIKDAMSEIPSSASAGPDRFPAILLKKCSGVLSEPLYILWRKSLDSGDIPSIYKTANVIPIHKGKGSSKTEAKNYRPIALTSHIIKIFEKVIRKYIVSYMESNGLFNPSQHGFRMGRSCLSQLLSHYEHILQLMEEGHEVDVIYLDFAKAFDKVDFDILLKKLHSLGVRGSLGRWIYSFLTGRTQTINVNGQRSTPAPVLSGVPQGSVLGPLMFLILIGDIDKELTSAFLSSFADDTRMGHNTDSPSDKIELQNDLNTVYQWTENNNMQLHGDKFEHLHYSGKTVRDRQPAHSYTSSSGLVIEEKFHVEKDLGVIMSNSASFEKQVTQVIADANSQAAWVLRTFSTRDATPMLTLFKSLVQCKLDYCSQLWAPSSKGEINKLEMVQRNFLRKISGIGRLPYWDQLKRLNLYSQERRRERYMIIYVWRILEGQVPNICDNERGSIRLKQNQRLSDDEEDRLGRKCDIPSIITNSTTHVQNLREASLSVRGQKLFNILPKHLRDIKDCTKETFKSALDRFLSTIPDEPHIQGYVQMRRAESNSLLHMIKVSNSVAESIARVEAVAPTPGPADIGCVYEVAVAR